MNDNSVPFPASNAKCRHGIPLYGCIPCSKKIGVPRKLVMQFRQRRFDEEHPRLTTAPLGNGRLPGGKFGKGSLK